MREGRKEGGRKRMTVCLQAYVIIGSRTPGSTIMWHTNHMGIFVKDPDESDDCCYYDLPFREPILIFLKAPTWIFARVEPPPNSGPSIPNFFERTIQVSRSSLLFGCSVFEYAFLDIFARKRKRLCTVQLQSSSMRGSVD